MTEAGAGKHTGPFAGPWLRFQSGHNPGNTQWTGSVLFLTREQGSNGAAAGAPPSLTLRDGKDEQRLTAFQLDAVQGWVFWRFNLALEVGEAQRKVAYSVTTADGTSTPTYEFWLQGLDQPLHWGYYSCNGMSESIPQSAPERTNLNYLWEDLLQLHAAFPLHCLVGGGDQLYNDGVWKVPSLTAWGANDNHATKVGAAWSTEMEGESTDFYLNNYINCFSMKEVQQAFGSIPQVMMWDDHDIWDGYGSYEADMQTCPVFQGLFKVARKFYLLFQQHTTDAYNLEAKEFLTNDNKEFHYVKWMGPQVVLLGIDMRSQRTKARIMPQDTYKLLESTVDALPSDPQHLVILSGIPLVFPKIPASESILGCFGRVTNRFRAIKNMARSKGIVDRFDQPEILDDLVDGWVAEVHTAERLQFINMLKRFVSKKQVRVSILSGDAHVGGVGRLYSTPKKKPLADDEFFMPQIISSAIVNAPPPHGIVRMLMRTNFASKVDGTTHEKMVRAFYPRHPRTDKLLGQRNWCDVTLVAPPFTPPTVPKDPGYGGLRFQIRAEHAHERRGYAEETYIILVPRHPKATTSGVPHEDKGFLGFLSTIKSSLKHGMHAVGSVSGSLHGGKPAPAQPPAVV